MKGLVMIGSLLACLTLSAAPLAAEGTAEWGAGIYQGGIGPSFNYPSLMVWTSPDFLASFGISFTTIESRSVGFYTKLGYRIADRGNTRILLGGVLELAELGDTTVLFAPFVGMDARVTNNFSVIADGYVFEIVADGDTEAFFFEGRLGAALWF
jgi:hypothetical protein